MTVAEAIGRDCQQYGDPETSAITSVPIQVVTKALPALRLWTHGNIWHDRILRTVITERLLWVASLTCRYSSGYKDFGRWLMWKLGLGQVFYQTNAEEKADRKSLTAGSRPFAKTPP